jgi:hypothetical protein
MGYPIFTSHFAPFARRLVLFGLHFGVIQWLRQEGVAAGAFDAQAICHLLIQDSPQSRGKGGSVKNLDKNWDSHGFSHF